MEEEETTNGQRERERERKTAAERRDGGGRSLPPGSCAQLSRAPPPPLCTAPGRFGPSEGLVNWLVLISPSWRRHREQPELLEETAEPQREIGGAVQPPERATGTRNKERDSER